MLHALRPSLRLRPPRILHCLLFSSLRRRQPRPALLSPTWSHKKKISTKPPPFRYLVTAFPSAKDATIAEQDDKKDKDDRDLLTELVESSYPIPKPRTDINKAYFPGKVYRSTSRDVVFRAMAGNTAITTLKILAWLKTGSSAMLSEAIHSLVDTGNQAVLILGLKQASGVPDKKHQYGYGRAAYFWSLISALGIFWLGSGATIFHGIQSILDPPKELYFSWEIWCVLAASFGIDGWVLKRSTQDLLASKPKNVSFYQHVKRIKDPFMMAVLYEDLAACTGVLMAGCGIGASHFTGDPLWDSIASISIGVLLGGVAVSLIRLNQNFLLGQSVEPDIENGIRKLLLARPSIDNVYAVQSQWVGPSTFSYKAEVDFDGTYLAAKLLRMYKPVFLETKELDKDLPLILAWYAEDVTRLVEKEVQEVEEVIRSIYPEAAFIELEPDSKESEMRALVNMQTKSSRTSEREAMRRALALLARTLERKSSDSDRSVS
ncbi:zinc transporter [Plasmopara halstedii]|uniref:Zinc transporter n=1 Tax=Plasmopara halstedii TaxID=4781 RepID=A0A0P1AXV7_PLAHL|nr:zinc transporter [Plasmopara halstedii]CEG46292.1 zinc transporter [Plasmopara halstedii]|eukprot:XP_024582661.1 zinc transporter [Plasmopara halstedii]